MVAADLDVEGAEKVAADTGGFGMRVDVGREADIQKLVAETIKRYGQIDLFCSNAGVFIPGGIDAPDADWLKMRDIHLLAHVYAARAVLPGMLARGEGYLLQTVSAAGLLTSLESVIYAVTKHAALGPRGMAFDDLWRCRHQSFGALPARRANGHADAGPE